MYIYIAIIYILYIYSTYWQHKVPMYTTYLPLLVTFINYIYTMAVCICACAPTQTHSECYAAFIWTGEHGVFLFTTAELCSIDLAT